MAEVQPAQEPTQPTAPPPDVDPIAARFARDEADALAAFQPAPPETENAMPVPAPVPAAAAPPPEPTPPEPTPPAEPIAEPPPAAPEPAPAETPPAQQTTAQHPTWRQLEAEKKRAKELAEDRRKEAERASELERQLNELRAEQARVAREQAAQVEQPYVSEEEQRLARLEQELAASRAQNEQTQMQVGIDQHVRSFVSTHPDYDQALAHLFEREMSIREINGDIDEMAAQVRQQFTPEQIRSYAIDHDKTSAEVVRDEAVRRLVQTEMGKMWKRAQTTGRNFGELVYERAQKVGWQGTNGNGHAAAPPPPAEPQVPSPAEQLRAEQTAAAAGSLAGMATRSTAPPTGELQTKAEVLAFQKTLTPTQWADYDAQRSATSPHGEAWIQYLR